MPNRNTPRLATVFVILVSALVACSTDSGSSRKSRLSPTEFEKKLFSSEPVQLVDCRTPAEFDEGHIEGAQNIDFRNASFITAAMELDKSQPVLFYCRSGKRSQGAMEMLREKDYKVYDLKGGIKAWTAEGRQLVK